MGFSPVLTLPQLQCLTAEGTEAPGAHKSGTETGIPPAYSSDLPWGVKTPLTNGLSSGRGHGWGGLGCPNEVHLDGPDLHRGSTFRAGGPGWENLGPCFQSRFSDLASWLGRDIRDMGGGQGKVPAESSHCPGSSPARLPAANLPPPPTTCPLPAVGDPGLPLGCRRGGLQPGGRGCQGEELGFPVLVPLGAWSPVRIWAGHVVWAGQISCKTGLSKQGDGD